jgi:hypothetical protein
LLPAEPDVIAYDENMGVIFQWSGCSDVEHVDALPRTGLARMAIQTAHLIRRRDGLILKGEVEQPTDYGDEIVLPVDEPRRKEPTRLARVDLIPPPEELVEHDPLSDAVLLRLALVKALELLDEEIDYIVIEDKDIVRLLPLASISIEHSAGGVMFRAHYGDLTVIPVADGEVDDIRERNVWDVACPKCDAAPLMSCTTSNGNALSMAQSHADRYKAMKVSEVSDTNGS